MSLFTTQIKKLLKNQYTHQVNLPCVAKKYNFILNQLVDKNKTLSIEPKLLYLKYFYINTLHYNLLKELKNLKVQLLDLNDMGDLKLRQENISKLQLSKIYTSFVEIYKKSLRIFLKEKIQKKKKLFNKKKKNVLLLKESMKWKVRLKKLVKYGLKKKSLVKTSDLVKVVSLLNRKLSQKRLFKNYFLGNKGPLLRKKIKRNYMKSKKKSKKAKCEERKIRKAQLENKLKFMLKLLSKDIKIIKRFKKLKRFYNYTFCKFRKKKKRFFFLYKKKIRRRRWFKKLLVVRIKTKKGIVRKLKKPSIFRYYRNRHRLYFHFYIPRYLEINYKTFCFIHLFTLDYSTIGHKIPFSLHLGKVQTKVAY